MLNRGRWMPGIGSLGSVHLAEARNPESVHAAPSAYRFQCPRRAWDFLRPSEVSWIHGEGPLAWDIDHHSPLIVGAKEGPVGDTRGALDPDVADGQYPSEWPE